MLLLLLNVLLIISICLEITPLTNPLNVQAAPVLTFIQPNGAGDIVPAGDDFATTVLGDAWDMNQRSDIYRAMNMTNVSFSGGIFEGTTTSNDTYIWLMHQGYPAANNINPHCGLVNPINAGRYHHLSFQMYRSLENSNVPIRIYWYKAGDEFTGQPSGRSKPLVAGAGWRLYQMDLANPSNVEAGTWSGNITGLRIDPSSTSDTSVRNVLVQLDWVRLTAGALAPSYEIRWLTSDPNQVSTLTLISIEGSDPGRAQSILATDILANQQNSYTWPVSPFPPGNYYLQAHIGNDYAGVVRGQPWDMSQPDQIAASWNTSLTQTAEGYSFTALTGDPAFALSIDPDHPINAGLYTQLTIRMYSSGNNFLNFYWTPMGGGQWSGYSRYLNTSAGWHTYTLSLPAMTAAGSWSGLIKELRVDYATSVGVTVIIDWIALTTGNTPAGKADLWPNVTSSQVPLTINTPPDLTITSPSMVSGKDYAATVLGDPWDMSNPQDIAQTWEIAQASFENGIYTAVTSGGHTGGNDWGDSQLWLHVGSNPADYIDTSQFKYLTLRACHPGVQDVGFGWVFRLLWAPNNIGLDHSTSDDFIVEDGWPSYLDNDCWQTYKMDLAHINLEPNGGPNLGWTGNLRIFRLDPTEYPYPAQFKMDYLKLTAMDQVNRGQRYFIRYELKSTFPVVLNFYYDTDKDPTNGVTLIGTRQILSSTPTAAVSPSLNGGSVYKTFLPFIIKGRGLFW